jgi:nucleotide-binding universal stress UspA family protein
MHQRHTFQSDKVSMPMRPAHAKHFQPADSFAQVIRTIVVPLDGTRFAEHALPQALAIARRSGASMRLVHVFSHLQSIDPWDLSRAPRHVKSIQSEKQKYLSRIAKKIWRTEGLVLETALVDSTDKVDALAGAVAGADLVVIASRRSMLASHLWWTSISDGLRRRLSTPMHLVQGYSSPVDLTADPIARHILLPLDGSIHAGSILEFTTRLATLEGAMVTLLNVQNERWNRGCFEHTTPQNYLLSTLRNLKMRIPSVEAHVITTDRSVPQVIAEFAEQRDVDLIAMASGADGGLARLLRGSIADRLIRRTSLPVLLQTVNDRPKRKELITIAHS